LELDDGSFGYNTLMIKHSIFLDSLGLWLATKGLLCKQRFVYSENDMLGDKKLLCKVVIFLHVVF